MTRSLSTIVAAGVLLLLAAPAQATAPVAVDFSVLMVNGVDTAIDITSPSRACPSRLESQLCAGRGFRNAPEVRFVGLRLDVTGGIDALAAWQSLLAGLACPRPPPRRRGHAGGPDRGNAVGQRPLCVQSSHSAPSNRRNRGPAAVLSRPGQAEGLSHGDPRAGGGQTRCDARGASQLAARDASGIRQHDPDVGNPGPVGPDA